MSETQLFSLLHKPDSLYVSSKSFLQCEPMRDGPEQLRSRNGNGQHSCKITAIDVWSLHIGRTFYLRPALSQRCIFIVIHLSEAIRSEARRSRFVRGLAKTSATLNTIKMILANQLANNTGKTLKLECWKLIFINIKMQTLDQHCF